MQAITQAPAGSIERVGALRISLLVVGYLFALVGCLLVGSFAMLNLTGAGFLIIFFSSIGIPRPALTWRSRLVLLIGCGVIIGVFLLFGSDRIRQWRPHPIGYIPVWILCFHAFRQFRLLTRGQKADEKING